MDFQRHLLRTPPLQNRKIAMPIGCVTAVLLVLTSCSKKEPSPLQKQKGTTSHQTKPIHDVFYTDIPGIHFDAGVRNKIHALVGEVPEISQLFIAIQEVPNLTIQFCDKVGFCAMLQKKGLTPEEAQKYIIDAGAMTFIPPRKSLQEQEQIYIYLSPHALANKQNFIEGVSNELLNALLATKLPNILTIKNRIPDISGGLNISPEEIQGIGIAFTKEYISGLVSKLITERYNKRNTTYSLSHLKDNLIKGIFWDSDKPGYAFDYFYNILIKHGFPVQKDKDLVQFYTHCINTNWGNIAKNTQAMCQWLKIPLQP